MFTCKLDSDSEAASSQASKVLVNKMLIVLLTDVTLDGAMERVAAGECITVPEDVYDKGCIHSMAEGLAAAIKIGFPVMIKASEGGKIKSF